jgi:hypothetical protein
MHPGAPDAAIRLMDGFQFVEVFVGLGRESATASDQVISIPTFNAELASGWTLH